MENKLDPSLELVRCLKITQKGRIFLFLFVILIGIFEFSRQNLKIIQNCTIAIFLRQNLNKSWTELNILMFAPKRSSLRSQSLTNETF